METKKNSSSKLKNNKQKATKYGPLVTRYQDKQFWVQSLSSRHHYGNTHTHSWSQFTGGGQ